MAILTRQDLSGLRRAGDALARQVREQARELRASDPHDPDTVAGADWLAQLAEAWVTATDAAGLSGPAKGAPPC
jgi:hypothetical protein